MRFTYDRPRIGQRRYWSRFVKPLLFFDKTLISTDIFSANVPVEVLVDATRATKLMPTRNRLYTVAGRTGRSRVTNSKSPDQRRGRRAS